MRNGGENGARVKVCRGWVWGWNVRCVGALVLQGSTPDPRRAHRLLLSTAGHTMCFRSCLLLLPSSRSSVLPGEATTSSWNKFWNLRASCSCSHHTRKLQATAATIPARWPVITHTKSYIRVHAMACSHRIRKKEPVKRPASCGIRLTTQHTPWACHHVSMPGPCSQIIFWTFDSWSMHDQLDFMPGILFTIIYYKLRFSYSHDIHLQIWSYGTQKFRCVTL